ncbi:ADP-ribosylglycohydrolase family protein [Tahibacter harae]|uniref:ADP-ribosylglycohydrolase family protein n=1 Tax=Tahibacter harae TaxID=2963937 RepID=A0ABT1QQY6_9GAMM|nr:ADP-ribosylglycohydrolase family protein [Tahibacter harae]MCQ4164716.1 ADP-ribosylglycohydrolase family protein [Tahibacter harae]
MNLLAQLHACLLGGAVGDSLGLPFEGLPARRARRWAHGALRQRFLLGRGMVSDDTDHTVFVAQALLRSAGDVDVFRRVLAWRLRWWLLSLPAGIGLGTLRGILKLWLGLRPSGVRSAGNGPAMRAALIGCRFAYDSAARRTHVAASALLTHTDPRALAGALAIAEAAARISCGQWRQRPDPAEFAQVLTGVSENAQWRALQPVLAEACASAQPTQRLREALGLQRGVPGFALHSVPFALLAWYEGHGDYAQTLQLCVDAGGDVDTNAAMAGALAALVCGVDGIPPQWRERLLDWPHGTGYLQRLAAALADPQESCATNFSAGLFLRSPLFLAAVLCHGLRRLLPPY